MFCYRQTKSLLHKEYRPSLKSWREANLIQGAVMTYHGGPIRAPNDCLYLCLDIPSMEKPTGRRELFLNQDLTKRIPDEISEKVRGACIRRGISVSYNSEQPPLDRLEVRDYEVFMEEAKSTEVYKAPMEEIFRFASAGTDVALEMLPRWDRSVLAFSYSEVKAMVEYAHAGLVKRLGADYRWMDWALHFVENSLALHGVFVPLAKQMGLLKN
jgi:hypothetical protein